MARGAGVAEVLRGGVVDAGAEHGLLAVGPGSLEIADAGALTGTVRSAGFRRGVIELTVHVDGIGEVTVVERSAGRTGAGDLPRPGATLRLRPTPGGVAAVG